ncbi:MAG: hypothetical protein ABI140_21420, partial [Jatrophihabitantaceae bacterium]
MDTTPPAATGHRPRWPFAVGLLAAGAVVGGIAATTLGASAATTTPSPSSSAGSSSSSSGSSTSRPSIRNEHGSAPVRSDEKAVSTTDAATLKAAALKAVPGGTVYRVETDAGDATYEAHMTKADG